MIQSISDIITNSSSEVFIIQTDNAERLKQFFEELLEHLGYNLHDIMYMQIMDEVGKIDHYDEYIPYSPGDLCIESATDNSIPSFLMDMISYLQYYKPPIIKDITITDVDKMHLG